MDTIIIGMLLSFIFSAFTPWLEKQYGFGNDKAKMAIILVLSFVLAIVTYITPEQYLQSATAILGSATATYWILWKIAFKEDKIASNIESIIE